MPAFRHIRTRMLVVYLLLLTVLLGAVLFAVQRAGLAQARAQAEARFAAAGKATARIMARRATLLEQGAEALADDGVFRQALREADLAALEGALAARAGRPGAEMAMLVSLDGRILASTRSSGSFGASFPCPTMIETAEVQGRASGYISWEQRIYQVTLVPVMAPRRAAWLALGTTLDDATAGELAELAGMPAHIVGMEDAGARLVASSLTGEPRRRAGAWLSGLRGVGMGRAEPGSGENWIHSVKLDSATDRAYAAAFTLSREEALASSTRLRDRLLLIAALALAAFAYVSSLLARGMTVPMEELASALRRLGRGHHDTRVTIGNRDELGGLAEGFNRLAGEMAARERRVTSLACHDPLTGLPNRACFIAQVDNGLVAGHHPPGLLLAATPARLESLGTGLGIAVADGLIQALAQRIQGREAWQVASLGGGRFALFCPLGGKLGPDDWLDLARVVLDGSVEWHGQRFEPGLRLGSAQCPRDGEDAESLLSRAEEALGRAREGGAWHVAWRPEFEADGRRRLALLKDLAEGMAAGQLAACYQPKARLSDGRVVAWELLARWRHPVHGLLLPQDFIAAAEQTALMRLLTRWAIDTAAAQAARWRRAGRDMAVSVNLAPRDLADGEVVEWFAAALASHGLPPAALVAEITESALGGGPDMALGVVQAIAALGVRLSLDDFGLGHSSLARLARLPLHELKIHQAVVPHMLDTAPDAAMVKAAIDLAHTLGLSVVAEGVETAGQWQRLVAYGCDEAQGHYLARPLEEEELDAWLAEREA